jgi:hypothetical protein
MNTNSPYTTGALTVTAYQIEPLVSWALTGFKAPMPPVVPGIISALAVMLVHAVANIVVARLPKS